MFVYSVRASSIKFVIVLLLCTCGMIGLFALTAEEQTAVTVSGEEIDYGNIKTNDDRIAFINRFGILVEEDPRVETLFSIPDSFDRVISGYNELQKAQGLDLTKYKGKRVTRYTYRVTNYDYDGEVLVNLLVYKSRIIAADISSADSSGFVSGIATIDRSKLK